MLNFCFLYFAFVTIVNAFPLDFVNRIAEGFRFGDADNYLPRYDDVISFQIPGSKLEEENQSINTNKNKSKFSSEGFDVNFTPYDLTDAETEIKPRNISNPENGTSLDIETIDNNTKNVHRSNVSFGNIELFDVNIEGNSSSEESETNRLPKQELNETKSDPEFESQEDGSSEEQGNMATSLLSAFLGGLSRPDGSIDLEAIIGLLGSLSSQNDDGSYNFQGLTDLLRGFFGGGGDDGGGSDIGSFVGGLLGAVIKGVANPPGAKGAGILTGKVVTGILPALSGPPPADDIDMNNQPQGLDSGGFLSGLIKTVLSSSSGGNNQGGGGGSNLFKVVFQLITSVLSASSKSH